MLPLNPDFLQLVKDTIKNNPGIKRKELTSLISSNPNKHVSIWTEEALKKLFTTNEVSWELDDDNEVYLFLSVTPEVYYQKLKRHRLRVVQEKEELQHMKNKLKENGFSFSQIKEVENKVFIEMSRRDNEN